MAHAYNREIFADRVRTDPFGGVLTQEQWSGMAGMLDYIDFLKWHPADAETAYFTAWNAYTFATTFHETARTMQPVTEYGSQAYLESKSYYPYIGRGRVQLTWEDNYRRSDDEIAAGGWIADLARFDGGAVNQHDFPDQALDDEVSNVNVFVGCWKGWYTGRKNWDYLRNDSVDYINARRIVNGTDKANTIATYAEAFEAALRAAWQPVEVEVPPPDLPPSMPPPGELPDEPKPPLERPEMPAHILEKFKATGAMEIRETDTLEATTYTYVYWNPLHDRKEIFRCSDSIPQTGPP